MRARGAAEAPLAEHPRQRALARGAAPQTLTDCRMSTVGTGTLHGARGAVQQAAPLVEHPQRRAGGPSQAATCKPRRAARPARRTAAIQGWRERITLASSQSRHPRSRVILAVAPSSPARRFHIVPVARPSTDSPPPSPRPRPRATRVRKRARPPIPAEVGRAEEGNQPALGPSPPKLGGQGARIAMEGGRADARREGEREAEAPLGPCHYGSPARARARMQSR